MKPQHKNAFSRASLGNRSKYDPHQGKKEKAKWAKRVAKKEEK